MPQPRKPRGGSLHSPVSRPRLDKGVSRADHAVAMRARIIKAAVESFSSKGFASTTMDDIAAAATVSRRTLFRYFATKEQMALAYQDGIVDILVPALAARPSDEGALEAMIATLSEFVRGLSREEALSLSDLLVANPSLRAHNLEKYRDIEVAFGGAVVSRCRGGDPEREAQVKAACAVGAWRTANEAWLDKGRVDHPAAAVLATFAELRTILRE